MKKITVVVIGFFILGLVTACQPVDEFDIDALYGVWYDETTGVYSFMNEDGTFLITLTNSHEFPIQSGTYTHKGKNVTFVMDEESQVCPGYTAVVEVEIIDDDRYQETIIEADCEDGLGVGGTFEWIRQSP